MKKGISLAVLVVTIIVLVILTAATVATISGENGVIDEAREATSDAKRQNAEDKLYMEIFAAQIRAAKENVDLYTYITTHATELKEVIKPIKTYTEELYEIYVGGTKIEATPRHEFYIVDKGWVRAYDLEEGDLVITKDGERLNIIKINYIKLDELLPVYNMTVNGNHNYLITDINILVHNADSVSA